MILGNSFFQFMLEKFNSQQLLFFLIGILLGVFLTIFIFLFIIMLGKKEIKPNLDLSEDEMNDIIIYYQTQFDNVDGNMLYLLSELKDLSVEMVYEIARKMYKDSKRPLAEISVENIIIGINSITDRIYKLLDNFTLEVNTANVKINEHKVRNLIEENEDLKLKKEELEKVIQNTQELLKKQNVNFFNKIRKRFNEEYSNLSMELEQQKKDLSNVIDNINKNNREISKIEKIFNEPDQRKIVDKLVTKNKDKLLDLKLESIFKEGKNKNIVNEKESFSKGFQKTIINRAINMSIEVAKRALGIKELLRNVLTIIGLEVYEIYKK